MGGVIDSIFGGGDDYEEPQSSQAAAQIAQQLFGETSPVRQGVVNTLAGYAGGPNPSPSQAIWQPARKTIEDQYQVAQENVMSRMPRGGQMFESMADIDMGRADSLGRLASEIGMIDYRQGQDMFDKAFTMATGVPQTSMAGLNMAGNTATSAMMANANQQAGKNAMMGDLGMAAGMYFS